MTVVSYRVGMCLTPLLACGTASECCRWPARYYRSSRVLDFKRRGLRRGSRRGEASRAVVETLRHGGELRRARRSAAVVSDTGSECRPAGAAHTGSRVEYGTVDRVRVCAGEGGLTEAPNSPSIDGCWPAIGVLAAEGFRDGSHQQGLVIAIIGFRHAHDEGADREDREAAER